ncbi:39S ribosomal protein L46, mitochondrial [Culex quinquefasciatus]|uniref:39S ribosomal protein L46, mitochondrial n=1 Tax=Culex quinquefasciatus TaxID=7176 RepID=UPI0018E3E0B6|nr:39S ribosomal protein L46, mitochondrial [Culex quinquefasciatus]
MSFLASRVLFRSGSVLLSRQASSKGAAGAGAVTGKTKEKWDLLAGVLVERLPVVTKTMEPIEAKFKSILDQIEFENSLKSNHELRKETEKRQAELLKAGKIDLDSEALKQTAQDLEDAYNDELSKFKPAPRLTEADRKGDLCSLERKLEETLVLLAEQKLGGKSYFLLPQGQLGAGETSLRQTAERVLRETVGDSLQVTFYGNAPVGFYKYKYPAAAKRDAVGAKVFFFRCVLKEGSPNVGEKSVKVQWLDQGELAKTLQEPYYRSVSQFLL